MSSLLAISENDTLFALIGTTYGGDGQTTLRYPICAGAFPFIKERIAALRISSGKQMAQKP
ncbi:MAG: tail fiber protein [Bacteroidetes Order II. Incertae sedis bacterium]|nr:tail fiber protein [Bacteroidetes Order II. bacterium]